MNGLDEPVFMALSKPMRSKFGIHPRLESCVFSCSPMLFKINFWIKHSLHWASMTSKATFKRLSSLRFNDFLGPPHQRATNAIHTPSRPSSSKKLLERIALNQGTGRTAELFGADILKLPPATSPSIINNYQPHQKKSSSSINNYQPYQKKSSNILSGA